MEELCARWVGLPAAEARFVRPHDGAEPAVHRPEVPRRMSLTGLANFSRATP